MNYLCLAIEDNARLKKLNLSKNDLKDDSAEILKTMLINNDVIRELYLRWNNFSSKGGLILLEGVEIK